MFRTVFVYLSLALLLQACAPRNIGTVGPQNPPLHQSVIMGQLDAVSTQLNKPGAAVNKQGPNGNTALHLAAGMVNSPNNALQDGGQYPNVAMVRLLLDHGADPNSPNGRSGATPLHGAASPKVVELLVSAGADVMALDLQDNTPLHYTSNPRVARALLRHGADSSATNIAGQTPLQAMKIRRTQFDRILRSGRVQSTAQQRALENQARQIERTIAVLSNGPVQEADGTSGTVAQTQPSGERLEHLVIEGNGGEYMCPWTSDGVLAEWVDKAINAKMGSAAGSAVGAYAGQKAMESVPFIGGFLGSKVGEAAGRKVAVEAAGGEDYIRRTSDLSFDSLNAMARYISANYADDRHFQDAVDAANEIYPGLEQAVAGAR